MKNGLFLVKNKGRKDNILEGIHLIMPMAGGGSRFAQEGFEVPKPLIELRGKPFFYWAAQSILRDINCVDVTFVVLAQHVKEYAIDAAINKFFPDAKIITVPEILSGAVCTCLKGIENIGDNLPVIFNDCDHMFRCKALTERLDETQPLDFDGALITFESSAAQFSYVKYDAGKKVLAFDVDFHLSFDTLSEYDKAINSRTLSLRNLEMSEYKVNRLLNGHSGCKIYLMENDGGSCIVDILTSQIRHWTFYRITAGEISPRRLVMVT